MSGLTFPTYRATHVEGLKKDMAASRSEIGRLSDVILAQNAVIAHSRVDLAVYSTRPRPVWTASECCVMVLVVMGVGVVLKPFFCMLISSA